MLVFLNSFFLFLIGEVNHLAQTRRVHTSRSSKHSVYNMYLHQSTFQNLCFLFYTCIFIRRCMFSYFE